MINIKDIVLRWSDTGRGIKKMPYADAVKDMEQLVVEVKRLENELKISKQDYINRCQQFEVMHIEIGNVIRKYT